MKQTRTRDARDWTVSVTMDGAETEQRTTQAVSGWWACANVAHDLGIRSDDLLVVSGGPHRCIGKTRHGISPAFSVLAVEIK